MRNPSYFWVKIEDMDILEEVNALIEYNEIRPRAKVFQRGRNIVSIILTTGQKVNFRLVLALNYRPWSPFYGSFEKLNQE